MFHLFGDSFVFEGDFSALVAASSGQDVDDGLFIHTCREQVNEEIQF